MTSRYVRIATFALAAFVAAACFAEPPLAPTPDPPEPGIPGPPRGEPVFPPLARAGDAYIEQTPLYGDHSPSGWPRASRYVLYADGRFALQFAVATGVVGEFAGRHIRSDHGVLFVFDNENAPGAWLAEGTLEGEILTVKYNVTMALSDFVGGTYRRSAGAP